MSACAWTGVTSRAAWAYAHMNRERPIEAAGDAPPNTDVELLRRMASGDSAALSSFYDAHANTLFGLAYRILGDHKEAEDVLQEVFLQVWEKAFTYDPKQGRPLAWVITLTRNKAIDRFRSAQRRSRLFEEAAEANPVEGISNSPSAVDVAGATEHARFISAALTRLPDEQKRAIELAFFGGLSQTEIAAALNEPLGTIKARIRRGMLKLREELEPWLRREAVVPPGDAGNIE